MSIKMIQLVFDNKSLKGNRRLMMLAIADNANDQGYCWPNRQTLAEKTNVKKAMRTPLILRFYPANFLNVKPSYSIKRCEVKR